MFISSSSESGVTIYKRRFYLEGARIHEPYATCISRGVSTPLELMARLMIDWTGTEANPITYLIARTRPREQPPRLLIAAGQLAASVVDYARLQATEHDTGFIEIDADHDSVFLNGRTAPSVDAYLQCTSALTIGIDHEAIVSVCSIAPRGVEVLANWSHATTHY